MSTERLSKLQRFILLEIDKERLEFKHYEVVGAMYSNIRDDAARALNKTTLYGRLTSNPQLRPTDSFKSTFCQSVNNLIAKDLVEDRCVHEIKEDLVFSYEPGEPKIYYHDIPDRKRWRVSWLWLTEKGLNLIGLIKDKGNQL